MAVTVERMQFSEVAGIRRLYEQSSEDLKRDFNAPTILVNRKWLLLTYLSCTPLRGLLPGRVDVWLAKDDGEIVGFCYIAEKGARRDLGIMVKEGQQGKGVGHKLMTAALENRTNVTLSVMYSNERARALYRKHGFETEMIVEYMRKR